MQARLRIGLCVALFAVALVWWCISAATFANHLRIRASMQDIQPDVYAVLDYSPTWFPRGVMRGLFVSASEYERAYIIDDPANPANRFRWLSAAGWDSWHIRVADAPNGVPWVSARFKGIRGGADFYPEDWLSLHAFGMLIAGVLTTSRFPRKPTRLGLAVAMAVIATVSTAILFPALARLVVVYWQSLAFLARGERPIWLAVGSTQRSIVLVGVGMLYLWANQVWFFAALAIERRIHVWNQARGPRTCPRCEYPMESLPICPKCGPQTSPPTAKMTTRVGALVGNDAVDRLRVVTLLAAIFGMTIPFWNGLLLGFIDRL